MPPALSPSAPTTFCATAARRETGPAGPGAGNRQRHDYLTPTSRSCPTSWTSTPSAPRASGSAPTRWAGPASTTGGHCRAAQSEAHRRQPAGGCHLAVHDPGHRRQDPDGLQLTERHGEPHREDWRPDRSPPATTPTPTGTASSPRRWADEPEPLPGRGHRLPVHPSAGLAWDGLRRQDRGVVVDHRPGGGRTRPQTGRGARRLQVVRRRIDQWHN